MSALVAPLTLLTLWFTGALVLAWLRRTRTIGLVALTLGVATGWALGTTPVADALLRPLEEPWERLDPAPLAGEARVWIVVLAGSGWYDPSRPPGDQLDASTTRRVIEGVRLQQALPRATLVLHSEGNGGMAEDWRSAGFERSPYRLAALALGADPERLRILAGGVDTAGEAALSARELPADEPMILVTSASHLQRSLHHFRAEGLDPVPAPADFAVTQNPIRRVRDYLPSASNLGKVERTLHERIGLWAARMGLS